MAGRRSWHARAVTEPPPPQCPTRTRLYRAGSVADKDEFDVDALITNWDLNAGLVSGGNQVAVLAHGLLDAVVDGHYLAVQQLDDAIEDLQDCLFQPRPGSDVRRRGYELSVRLARLRRVVAPMQDVVARLVRSDSQLVDETLAPYFHDVADHSLRAAETIDAGRDRINSIVETQLNEQSAQLNEITKKLAAWAAIIAVPTAVTGFYGQNVRTRASGATAASSRAASSSSSSPAASGSCCATGLPRRARPGSRSRSRTPCRRPTGPPRGTRPDRPCRPERRHRSPRRPPGPVGPRRGSLRRAGAR
ncbi:Mg2 transporter protein CorA family protein [Parafrankia sp. EAN1pec]|nr:Mg2 transporter protein CorA family protein [Frankia sp. EAN1pec]